MPRPRPIPVEDKLLAAGEAGDLLHVSRSRWDGYWRRFPALVRGCRVVQANPQGRGVRRWLRSALVEHMHCELAREFTAVPADRPRPAVRPVKSARAKEIGGAA
jgi:hypothetical protein